MAAVQQYQPTCQVCFLPGHCFRNCAHPAILASHGQGLEAYKRYMLAPTNQNSWADMQHWTSNLSRGIMRVLICRYAHPAIKTNFNHIRDWRTWRSEYTSGSRSDPLSIPARTSVQAMATLEELRFMIDMVYTTLAKEVISVDVDSIETMLVNDHVEQLRVAFMRFQHSLSRNRNINLSANGLQNYAQDIIRYLETIVLQQQEGRLMTPLPTPVLHDEYLNTPLLPIRHIPMPHPVLMVDATDDDDDDDDMFNNYFIPLRTTRPEPSFTIDLRLYAPASSEPTATANATNDSSTSTDTAHEELIQCGICWDEVDDERRIITNCNHNFCDGCITSQLDTIRVKHRSSGDVCRYLDLTCALCRQNVHTLSHNIADHAKIHAMKNVLYRPNAAAAAAAAAAAV